MADLSDVETALGQLVGSVLYPSGASGENPSPVANLPVLIQAGWPSPQSLDTMLASGKVMVTIYPRPVERNVTRYPRRWATAAAQPHTYTLSLSGLVLTIGGAAPNPFYVHNIAVYVNGTPYVYQTLAGQAPSDVAAAMQAFIVQSVAGVTSSGPAITFPDGTRIGYAREGTGAATQREVRRQDRQFQITVWANSPASRTLVASLIDPVLAVTDFLTLPDGSKARLVYHSTAEVDADQKQGIYRRDLIYSAEYPTLQTGLAPEIVVADVGLYDPFGNLMWTNDPQAPVFSFGLDFSDSRNSFNLPNN